MNNLIDAKENNKIKKAIDLFEKIPLWKTILRVIGAALIISFVQGLYLFVDQLLITKLIPENINFSENMLYSPSSFQFMQQNWLIMSAYSTSSIIRTVNSICNPILNINNGIALTLGISVAMNFSKTLGKKEYDKAKNIWRSGFYTTIISSFLISAVMIGFSFLILPSEINTNQSFEGVDQVLVKQISAEFNKIVLDYSSQYVMLIVSFNFLNALIMTISNLLASEGRNLLITVFVISSSILNICLDLILLTFTGIGILGAATATIISWVYCLIALFVYLHYLNKKEQTLLEFNTLSKVEIKFKILLMILLIGLPTFLANAGSSIYFIVQQIIFSDITTDFHSGSSSYFISITGATQPIFTLLITSMFGFVRGGRTVISYTYFHQNYVRMKKAISIIIISAFITGVVLFVFGAFVLSSHLLTLFNITKGNENYNDAMMILKFILASLPFYGVNIAGMLYFQSTFKIWTASLSSIMQTLLCGIPLLFIMKTISIETNDIWYFISALLTSYMLGSIINFTLCKSSIYRHFSKAKLLLIQNNNLANK